MEEIKQQFCFFSKETYSEKLLPLLESEIHEVLRRLRPGIDFESARPRLESLTAALAWKKYSLINGGGESFKIGEISVGERKGASGAAALAGGYLEQCADLLEDKGFFFRGIG